VTELVAAWPLAFSLTLALEAPLVAVVLVRLGRGWWGRRWGALLGSVLPSTLTHPLLWFVWWPLWWRMDRCWEASPPGVPASMVPACAALQWGLGEGLVVGVEAGVLVAMGLRPLPALGVSLGVNAGSALLGGWLLHG
jgi:hypothetical protein